MTPRAPGSRGESTLRIRVASGRLARGGPRPANTPRGAWDGPGPWRRVTTGLCGEVGKPLRPLPLRLLGSRARASVFGARDACSRGGPVVRRSGMNGRKALVYKDCGHVAIRRLRSASPSGGERASRPWWPKRRLCRGKTLRINAYRPDPMRSGLTPNSRAGWLAGGGRAARAPTASSRRDGARPDVRAPSNGTR